MAQSHPPAHAAPGTPGQALGTDWAGDGASSSRGPAADGGARGRQWGRAWWGPACQGSATGGDVFADINHRGEQCGRAGERALRHAKPAIKYLP